jgi:polyhydroxybutyrate depolymerase
MRHLTDLAIAFVGFLLRATGRSDRWARRAIKKVIFVDGLQRYYLVFTPNDTKWPMPVVIVLHAGGGSARRMERHTGFNELAAKEGFVVIYPESIGGNWNDGRGCSSIRAQRENIDDVKFVRLLVHEVAKQHNIDHDRVFATGASNGAMLSHRLAAEASDLICAIAPVVGGMPPAIAIQFHPEFSVSILIIQGDSDSIVAIDGGDVIVDQGEKRGKVISTKAALAKYCQRNGNLGDPARMTLDADPNDRTSVEIAKYPDAPGGEKAWFYLVKGGGHAWPGGKPHLREAFLGTTSQDFSATEVIWDFFKGCPLRSRK